MSKLAFENDIGETIYPGDWIRMEVHEKPGVGKFSGIYKSTLGVTFKLYHFRFELEPSFKDTWTFKIGRNPVIAKSLAAARRVDGPLKPAKPHEGVLQ